MPAVTDALYLPDGPRFVPTPLTQGPWDPDAQHGGPPAALCVRAVERCPSAVPMQVARLTIDLFRAVPLTPLEVRTSIVRDGKRLQVVDVSLLSGDVEVSRARALRIRADESIGIGPLATNDAFDEGPPPPEAGWPFGSRGETIAGFYNAVEHRRFDKQPGRRRNAWIRLLVPVVAGEAPSPVQRLAAAADIGSGISVPADFRTVLQINAELTIHVLREPVDEWIGLSARTILGTNGVGQSDTVLFDRDGRVGSSLQSLLVERR
jgi:Thioesterase-like superfamily